MQTGLLKAIVAGAATLYASVSVAGPREQAYRLFNRLNGVPPTVEKWDELEALIKDGKWKEAALSAIDDDGGNFYNITLKNLVAPWTNEDGQVRVPLNDYTATVIGMTRDEIPFNRFLWDDIVYTGVSNDPAVKLTPYSLVNNDHYTEIEAAKMPLHRILVRKKQSELSFLTDDAAAGVYTTRGWASAYYNMGTNRAALKFTMKTFLCKEMEDLSDTSRPDFHVRRDVTRAPGGEAKVFKSTCVGCHAGMDGNAGAFAYLDFTDQDGLIYNPTQVQTKYNRNETEFPAGYVTTDDSWINLWTEGKNASIGWNGRRTGKGHKEWGRMISQTDAFPQCMAKRALTAICAVDPDDEQVKLEIEKLAHSFAANGQFNMKNLFAEAALRCVGK